MAFLFDSFEWWKKYAEDSGQTLAGVVLEYEREQKGRTTQEIYEGLSRAWAVMKDAVKAGLEEDMTSRSGMIDNGAKKVYRYPKAVLSKEFQQLIARALAAKEVIRAMPIFQSYPSGAMTGSIAFPKVPA